MKKLVASVLSSGAYLSLASFALANAQAASPGGGSGDGTSTCPPTTAQGGNDAMHNLCLITGSNVGQVVGAFVELIFVLAILAALLYLVWGGFKWLTSGGDKSAVGAAREHIVAALVGLVIIFLSYFILTIVLNLFGLGGSITNIKFPTIPRFF